MSAIVRRFFLPLVVGGVLGTSVLAVSAKAIALVCGAFIVLVMAIFPEFAFYAVIATLQVAVEIGGGLTVSRIIIPLAGFLMVVNALAGRSPWPVPLVWPESFIAFAYFFWIVISILLVENSGEVAREAAGLIVMPFLFFCTFAFVRDERAFERLIWVIVLTGFGQAVFTVAQHKLGFSLGGAWRASQLEGEAFRAEGTSAHPILLAGYLQIVIALTAVQIFRTRNPYIRGGLLASIAVSYAAWYFTYARSSWVGMAVFLYVALAVSSRSGRNLAIAMGIAGLAVFILARQAPELVLQAIESVPMLARAFQQADMNPALEALRFRGQSSLGGWLLFLEHPLVGVGYGQAVANYVELLPYWATSPNHPSHIHNTFLEIASELGLIGLSLFVGLWICSIHQLRIAWRKEQTRLYSKVMIAILAGQFAFMLITPMMREIWLTLAMASVLGRIASKLPDTDLSEVAASTESMRAIERPRRMAPAGLHHSRTSRA